MPLSNRSKRSAANGAGETAVDADETGTSGRRFGRRALALGTAVAVGVGVGVGAAVLRRRRRPKREFTEIELDADPAER